MCDSQSYPAKGLPEGRRGRGAERLAGVPEAGARRSVDGVEGCSCIRHHAALALVKSHYPFVDLKRIEARLTAETDEAKFDQLLSEAEPTAEVLVGFMNIDDLE